MIIAMTLLRAKVIITHMAVQGIILKLFTTAATRHGHIQFDIPINIQKMINIGLLCPHFEDGIQTSPKHISKTIVS
jgi:hypothetical protein